MEDVGGHILEKVQALSDIELAVLLCLVSDQHCIVETEKHLLEELEQELQLVASSVFGLTCATLECSQSTTLDEFGNGILVDDGANELLERNHARSSSDLFSSSETTNVSDKRSSTPARAFSPFDSKRIANVVIAKDLNLASSEVQTQALELIRGKRNYTRTAVHTAPKPFVLVALRTTGSNHLTTHLNDQFYISHEHQAADGFPNLQELQEQAQGPLTDDNASQSSVIRSSPYKFHDHKPQPPVFSMHEIDQFAKHTAEVKMSSEVRAYLHNIVIFMRLHRAVGGGISAMATRHFAQLAHSLAPLHGLNYVTPSLVALAARKIYPHRIVIALPEHERSMQWGSSLGAVRAVLEGVTVGDIIEEVLQSVEAPL